MEGKEVRSQIVRLLHGRDVVRILRDVRMDLREFSKHCQIWYVVLNECSLVLFRYHFVAISCISMCAGRSVWFRKDLHGFSEHQARHGFAWILGTLGSP